MTNEQHGADVSPVLLFLSLLGFSLYQVVPEGSNAVLQLLRLFYTRYCVSLFALVGLAFQGAKCALLEAIVGNDGYGCSSRMRAMDRGSCLRERSGQAMRNCGRGEWDRGSQLAINTRLIAGENTHVHCALQWTGVHCV